MLVFIVTSYRESYNDQIEGVFSSHEKADKYIENCRGDVFYKGCQFLTTCEEVDDYA